MSSNRSSGRDSHSEDSDFLFEDRKPRTAPDGRTSQPRNFQAGQEERPRPNPRPSSRRKGRKTQKKTPAKSGKGKQITLTVIFSLLLVCLITALVVGGTILVYGINTINGSPVFDLNTEKMAQNQTTIIYGKDKNDKEVEITRLHGEENRIWVDLDEMSPYLYKAYVSIEDTRFAKHHGVDWFRTISAVVRYGGKQGGSTITQQLIKNLTDQKDVTIVRKFNEILSALNLEKHYSKDEIMEAYLNTIYLSHGCYGVKTAAQTYFGKDVKDLNIAESATLAVITQFPSKYDPLLHPKENKERQERCLNLMLEDGSITQAEYDEAVAYKLVFTNSPEYKGSAVQNKTSESNTKIQSYYVDYVISTVISDLSQKYGYSEREARNKLYGGGLKIYTAIDFEVQKALEDVYVNKKTLSKDTKAQSAMVIMDYQGRVVAMVGGTGKKTRNLGFNRATQAVRQPGSSIKPLTVYGPAIDLNAVAWSTLIQNSSSQTKDGKPWPKNDDGSNGNGQMLPVQECLSQSINTAAVRILEKVTISRSYDYALNKSFLGHLATTGNNTDYNYSSLGVGGTHKGVTVLEMAAAYQMFGNGGKYYDPFCYYKVTDASGKEVMLQSNSQPKQVISAGSATVMNKMMQTVITGSRGTGRSYSLGSDYEMIGKTGTTTDKKDRWFVGGTPYYVAAVWYGFDTPKTINVSGNPSGALFKAVMTQVHKGLPAKQFDVSDEAVEKQYCADTGLLASEGCPHKASGWFKSESLPALCSQHPAAASVPVPEETTAAAGEPATQAAATTAAQQ